MANDFNFNQPIVRVSVMILKDGFVLLGIQKSAEGQVEYVFPTRQLEYMESFDDCARREVLEKCGLKIKNINFRFVANITTDEPYHYVYICLVADWEIGQPQVLEPEKYESWDWHNLDNLPEPLAEITGLSIENYKKET